MKIFSIIFILSSFLTLRANPITLVMTVDWEGRSISKENLNAIKGFRADFPQIPMLHFLNPAYFTKENANPDIINSQIKSVLDPKDEQGLHIHAWKSLVNYCGLQYQSGPVFGTSNETCQRGDCGHTVSLEHAYSEEELKQLVGCSKKILIDQGYNRIKSFRAGGWQLGNKLAIALVFNGINLDSSRTDAKILIPQWGADSNLVKMVANLHPGATILDQPFDLIPGLLELPDNGSLADYTPSKTLADIFKELIKNDKNIMVLGFHLETAATYLPQLKKGILEIERLAKDLGIDIKWAQFPLI